jgi:hypothetical protein
VIVLPLGAFLHLLVRALNFFCMQGTFAYYYSEFVSILLSTANYCSFL